MAFSMLQAIQFGDGLTRLRRNITTAYENEHDQLSLAAEPLQCSGDVSNSAYMCVTSDETSPGKYLATGQSQGHVSLYDCSSTPGCVGTSFRLCASSSICSLSWYGVDPGAICAASANKKIWVVSTTTLQTMVQYSNAARSSTQVLHCCKGTPLLASSCDHDVRVLDLRQRASAHTLTGHRGAVRALRWRDAQQLVTGDSEGVVLWWDIRRPTPVMAIGDMSASKPRQDVPEAPARVRPFSQNPAGVKRRFSSLMSQRVARPGVHKRAHDASIDALALVRHGRALLTYSMGDRSGRPLRLWDSQSGHCEGAVGMFRSGAGHPWYTGKPPPSSIALSPDPSDSSGKVWVGGPMIQQLYVTREKIRAEQLEVRGHFGAVNDVAYCLASNSLVSGGSDGQLLRWSPSSGEAEGAHEMLEEDMWSSEG